MNPDYLIYLSRALAFILAFTVHEFAHAFVAYKLGDSTAKYQGRLSFNPIKHLDPFGSVIFPLTMLLLNANFIFGWAKPVPVNTYNLRGKYGTTWVSLAGPLANFSLAIIFALILRILPTHILSGLSPQFLELIFIIIILNLVLGVFNLIPVPPLDGSKILMDILPPSAQNVKDFLERYSIFLFIMVIVLSDRIIDPIVGILLRLLGFG